MKASTILIIITIAIVAIIFFSKIAPTLVLSGVAKQFGVKM